MSGTLRIYSCHLAPAGRWDGVHDVGNSLSCTVHRLDGCEGQTAGLARPVAHRLLSAGSATAAAIPYSLVA